MKVGLIDIDSKIPNLALMKISAFHKTKGDTVELTVPIIANTYDQIYASKVFTWSEMPILPDNAIIGGTGYDLKIKLSEEIEDMCPDYNLYPNMEYSMGFLTRGCIRKCPWCFVPEKEGMIYGAAFIEDFARHKHVLLLDNNVLACEWGLMQIEKIATLGLKVDFNQGLDARLIDDSTAKLLSKVKWWNPIRLACDTKAMMPVVQKAVEALRWHNVTPMRYSCYVLLTDDIEDCVERVRFLKGIGVDPFVQPYRSPDGREPSEIQKKLARYVDHKAIFKSITFDEYSA
jgi:hypothetical protein